MLNLMSSPLPPPPTPADMKPFFDLLALIADPPAARAVLQEWNADAMVARTAIFEAKTAQAELRKQRDAFESDLQRARDEHEEKLASDRAAFDESCRKRRADLHDREVALADLEASAKANADEVASLKKELEKRLASLREAMR